MTSDLIAFIAQMDRCWLERRFEDLANHLAADIVLVAPGGQHRLEGREAAIESYREFMSLCEVRRLQTHDHIVTQRGAAAIVEYGWDMAWSDQGTSHEARGREILALTQYDEGWRVFWRTQLPA